MEPSHSTRTDGRTDGHDEVIFVVLTKRLKTVFTKPVINLLAPEVFFLFLAHPVYKMWIIQETNTLDLWNKLHFGEEKTESIYHV